MCGIAGIYSSKSSTSIQSEVKTMTDSLVHRGPDGEGQWINHDTTVALGHRRLSIIDLTDSAAQPMHSQCGRYVIVFNGEIYNYIELRNELISQGETFTSNSDTEVLLRMYQRKKQDCLNDLDGMFAFAIWDQEEEELFCARDRFGEKPFHYSLYEGSFYFASEMKALWAAGVPKERNEAMFQAFSETKASFNPTNLSETFYTSIRRLPHSHFLVVNKKKELQLTKYYDIDWKKQSYKGSFSDACVEFKRLFELSLKRRFRADVAIGTSLSGGLDSSTIVCSIFENLKNVENLSPYTFSARFKNFKKDEGTFIEKVIEKTGFNAKMTWPNGSEMAEDIEKLCFHQEEPFSSASIYAQYRVQQLAKENNITILIDGQGADEILAGYSPYYYDYLQSLFKTKPFLSRFRRKEQKSFLDFHTPHTGLKKMGMKLFNYYELKGRIKPPKNAEPLNYHLYKSTMCGPLQELLRFADRNAMAHSREVRLPFLFHELVEFCFSLPDEYKLKLGWTKYILRSSFEPILPSEICWRKEKVGFEPPQEIWLKDSGSAHSTWNSYILECFR